MTMIAVRRRSTVTFCGAQLMVAGIGEGAGMAMSTVSCEAYHTYCEPKPKTQPDCRGSARFSTAAMVVLPLLGCPARAARAAPCSLQVRCQQAAAKSRTKSGLPIVWQATNCQELLQILRN